MRLRTAYHRTEYRVLLGSNPLLFRIGHHNAEAEQMLVEHCGLVEAWFILTPCNPRSKRARHLDNRRWLRELNQSLRALRLPHWPTLNHDPTGRWPGEAGVLLVDVRLDQILGLGRQFRQNALLTARLNQAPELLWL